MPCAYYNEIDPNAAAWIRELILAGIIAPGEVDERSIVDVRGSDLAGFTQCHFFAGIGVWSHALRSAGWPDTRPVWTGSCPCQSFSAAGSGRGFDDERHLWPHFFRLIREQRPGAVFGEQVASKDGLAWLDFVCADMESEGYAIAPLDLCAAGFGAPHIRQRLFFVADTHDAGRKPVSRDDARTAPAGDRSQRGPRSLGEHRDAGSVADSKCERGRGRESWGEDAGHVGESGQAGCALGDAAGRGLGIDWRAPRDAGHPDQPGPTNGFWRDADWIPCRDGKARPVESGTFPLAHGAPERVGRLRGYGNAIVAPVAEEFIRAYIEERFA